MPIRVTCDCGKVYHFKDEFAGRRAKCPACGIVLTIPGVDQAPSSSPLQQAPPDTGRNTSATSGFGPQEKPETDPEWLRHKPDVMEALDSKDEVDRAWALDLINRYAHKGVAEAKRLLDQHMRANAEERPEAGPGVHAEGPPPSKEGARSEDGGSKGEAGVLRGALRLVLTVSSFVVVWPLSIGLLANRLGFWAIPIGFVIAVWFRLLVEVPLRGLSPRFLAAACVFVLGCALTCSIVGAVLGVPLIVLQVASIRGSLRATKMLGWLLGGVVFLLLVGWLLATIVLGLNLVTLALIAVVFAGVEVLYINEIASSGLRKSQTGKRP